MKEFNNNVYYIGVDDLKSTLFESQYIIPEGIAYNSYLIKDNKIAIMDTVDAVMAEEWKQNLMEALAGQTPDYLVAHHMEPDHSSLIDWVLNEWPNIQLVASNKAIQMLGQFYENLNIEGRTIAVKEGDVLDLGSHKLQFIAAPMVHWPEVMVSYDQLDGTLYSADAFGKFGALSRCGFNDSEDDDWTCEARRYYFNICGKYGAQVKALLAKVSKLDVKTIRSLHGPMLENNLDFYVGLYSTWSNYDVETPGIFIAVASIHGSTLQVANKFAEILKSKGAEKVVVSDLCRSDAAENVEDAFRYSHLVLAASTYDGGVFTPMHEFIHRLKSKGYCRRTVGLIENGTWAPCAARVMHEMLDGMKEVEVLNPVVTIRSHMKSTDIPAMELLADALLQK